MKSGKIVLYKEDSGILLYLKGHESNRREIFWFINFAQDDGKIDIEK